MAWPHEIFRLFAAARSEQPDSFRQHDLATPCESCRSRWSSGGDNIFGNPSLGGTRPDVGMIPSLHVAQFLARIVVEPCFGDGSRNGGQMGKAKRRSGITGRCVPASSRRYVPANESLRGTCHALFVAGRAQ